jgi:hypothetical protein
MIIAKLHRVRGNAILAACDSELLGKCLKGKEGVKLSVKGDFFDGDEVSDEEFKTMLCQATSANLIGKRTVAAAIKFGHIDPDCVTKIAGIPHALMFCV